MGFITKKTDFGIDFNSESSLGWVDNVTYATCYDLADDVDDNGDTLKAWLEVEYHADDKEVVFVRTTEADNGNGGCESENVEKRLPRKTIKTIMDRLGKSVGIDFVI